MSWMPGDRPCACAVGVEPHRRVRRRPAAAPPDLRRAAHPAQEPVRLRLAQLVAPVPAGELGRTVVAGEQLLARVGQPADLVDVDVVAAAQLERVELERERELVDRLLEHRHALHHPGRAERVLGAQVRLARGRSARARRRSGRSCEHGLSDGEDPAALRPSRSPRRASIAVSVPSRRAPSRTVCRVAARRPPSSCSAWRSLTSRTGRPVIAGELGGRERLEAGALLARRSRRRRTPSDHAHVAPCASPKRRRELLAGGEHALRRDPGGELVAVPRGDGARAARAASAAAPASRASSSTVTSAPASAASASPRAVVRRVRR